MAQNNDRLSPLAEFALTVIAIGGRKFLDMQCESIDAVKQLDSDKDNDELRAIIYANLVSSFDTMETALHCISQRANNPVTDTQK